MFDAIGQTWRSAGIGWPPITRWSGSALNNLYIYGMHQFLYISGWVLLCLFTSLSCTEETVPKESGEWFSVSFEDLCKTDSLFTASEEWRNGRQNHAPYRKKQEEQGDTLTITFDFLADCCLKFYGHPEITEDTLYLHYYLPPGVSEPCECKCDYRMKYVLHKPNHTWRHIKIVHDI